ncbi:MAG: TonB-dependent receptor [Bacteroidales bacterium]|nr:TonB-dependent receptor [Bacteroidales bacterium]
MFRKVLLTFGLLLMAEMVALAQGTLKGTITDAKTKEALPFVNVVVKQDGKQVHGGQTDFDGIYTIKPLSVGKYDIEVSYVGYNRYVQTGINVKASGFTVVDVALNPTATTLEVVDIVADKVPVIEIGSAEQGARLSSDDIARMPGNSVESIVASVGGIGYSDGGTGTARGESGMVTQQGNVRKRTGIAAPKEAIAEIQVILGGTPASIGEAIGGTQIITLKPPTSQFKGLVRWETLLDYRLYNALVLYLTGPVFKKNFVQADGSSIERTLVGFRLTGQAAYEKSPFYRVKGYRYQIVKDELVRQFEENPLSYDPLTGGVNYSAETQLHKEDFYEITRLRKKNFTDGSRVPNLQYYSIGMEGALDFRFSDYATLTLTGEFSYSHSPSSSISPLTMPLMGQMVGESVNMALTVDFTQRFPDAESSNEDEAKATSPIKNVMYNVTGMINRYTTKSYDETFGSSINDVFKYGYIGKFITEKIPTYELRQINYNGIQQWANVQNNWRDQVTYVSPNDPVNGYTTYNPILANYNEQLFFSSEFQDIQPYLTTRDYINLYKGLYSGDSPSSIYRLINNVGVKGSSFSKSQNDYLYLQAKASADIKGHEIEVGFQYDQMWQSSYYLDAYSLWTIMRQNANRHILQMNTADSAAIYEQRGSQLYVSYPRLLDSEQQSPFDAAFRKYLMDHGYRNTDGSLIDEYTWIDIDRYSPDEYVQAGGIEMFSADELFNSGNQIVSYLGYDHAGKKYNGRDWSFDRFFNSDERLLPAFSPIYMAGYIQDKFYFQDLIFNVGVRVDYFNGNQWVLKDPYLLYQSYTVADIRNTPSLISGGDQYLYTEGIEDWIPYVSYVPDETNTTMPTIVGYRSPEGKWYDASGTEVASPSDVNGVSGKPTPYRTSGEGGGQDAFKNNTVYRSAFERYTPQIVAMPRIAFSFPIGEKSQFKASYDIIARRPSSGWEASYLSYLYMTQVSLISNPNLKPERITNYELGFQQALNQSSAISASAYYKETRDLIQLVQYAGADPNPNYYSYDNKDFRTIKGVTLAYDLRQTKNIRINANYTLQYAEGTGLSSTTMTELIKEGYTTLKMLNPISDDRRHEFKANVDFRYRSGAKYNGPTITRVVTDKETGEKRKKEIKLLENFGIDFLAVAQSGRPYTKQLSNSQATIVGGYRGARMPWGFYFNVVADKVWFLNVGKRETYLKVDLTVNNLFDIRNIVNVWPVTGNPEDNGYLTDPESQQIINAYLDPQAYRDIYTIILRNNTWYYSGPRTIRLSVSYNF